jgi:hypothetical protein
MVTDVPCRGWILKKGARKGMSDFHPIGYTETSRRAAEQVSPAFVRQGILVAREKSWIALKDIQTCVREGLTEREALQVAIQILKDHQAQHHWHKPYVRFGPGTALTFRDPLQKEYRLQPGDPFYIDLGPVFTDSETGIEYEGDVGDTFVFGENAEAQKCIDAAHSLFHEAHTFWRQNQASGKQVYELLATQARTLGYTLAPEVLGHRLSDFPHSRYTKQNLAAADFTPSTSLWVLEVQLLWQHPSRGLLGAFYEDLLLEK